MYSDELINFVNQNWDKKTFIITNKDKETLGRELAEQTSFLDEIYTKIGIRHRAYVVKNNITKDNLPLCKNCQKKPAALNHNASKLGFRDYCSIPCSITDTRISDDAVKLLSDKDWLYDQRVNKRIAIETIGDNLGVSHVTVDKYLKIHKIRDVIDSTRKLSPKQKEMFENKEVMYDLYVTQDKTYREIAAIIGCSTTLIKQHLLMHGIEIKKSNAYNRKFNKTSNEEKEVLSFIKSVSPKTVNANDRKTLNGKEIDVFIPDLNLGIEYHGIYSHVYRPHESKKCLIKGPDYHLGKCIVAKNKGVRLIQLYSSEWNHSNETSKDIIRRKLLVNKKISIFDCSIKMINTEVAISFIKSNSLNPSRKIVVSLGAYYENNLVYVMTFYKNKLGWSISNNVPIISNSFIGGTIGLIKYFRNINKGSFFVKVDRRFSEGTLYSSLGFTLYKVLEPKYYYTNNSYTKLYDAKILEQEAKKTNQEEVYFLRKNPKYRKIYDCGSLIFKLE